MWKICFLVNLKLVIWIMIDIIFRIKRLLIIVSMILCLMVMVMVLSVLLSDSDLVLFMKIIVGGVFYYRKLSFVLRSVL